MSEKARARDLLRRAREVYDAPGSVLKAKAPCAWRSGFASGGRWMRQALEQLRGRPLPGAHRDLNLLGTMKYALAGIAALAFVVLAVLLRQPVLALLCVPAFYAIEAQMVFLFPLALDSSDRSFRESWRWTRRAGGTLHVMRVVLPLACTMLLGGLAGRGFVRSWCLGCLAVCIWYEDLRGRVHGSMETEPRHRGIFSFRFGAFGPLLVRREEVALGLARPWRVLYVSDLHLGHWWNRRVPAQVVNAALSARPDVILLGGDLADSARALPLVQTCVRALTGIAPVYAVPGNHDPLQGRASLPEAVEAGGGRWLPQRPLLGPVQVDAVIDPRPESTPRVLCAHYPSDFPAAVAAGYRLVLAGHLHGGQCVLFRRKGRLYPAAWFHHWHGLRFHDRGATLLVSRGAADTFPLRFNCPREAVLCVIC